MAKTRIANIDLVRGLAMVLMVLDHTREYLHVSGFTQVATDLSVTTPALFFTRWITHFCAPAFVFLAGASAHLQRLQGKAVSDLARFLLVRGLVLVMLELTIVRLGIFFAMDLRIAAVLQVIWAIGVSMIVMAGMIFLPVRWIAGVSFAVIGLHNLAEPSNVAGGPGSSGLQALARCLLHEPSAMDPLGGQTGPTVLIVYPLIPWVGVMAAGYSFGSLFRMPLDERRRTFIALGWGMLVAFVMLRTSNAYGDPQPWSVQRDPLFTVISFLNVTKYPASLSYLLLTLGFTILILGILERRPLQTPTSLSLITFGRVPLFYYLIQWPLCHALAIGVTVAAGHSAAYLLADPIEPVFRSRAPGFSLPVVYLCWLACLLLLLPLCRWFAATKARANSAWLSYL